MRQRLNMYKQFMGEVQFQYQFTNVHIFINSLPIVLNLVPKQKNYKVYESETVKFKHLPIDIIMIFYTDLHSK